MRISIIYCKRWNFLPRAVSLAESIESELGIAPEPVIGENAVFDVIVDGDVIFSKKKEHRFPETEEIIRMVKERSESWARKKRSSAISGPAEKSFPFYTMIVKLILKGVFEKVISKKWEETQWRLSG